MMVPEPVSFAGRKLLFVMAVDAEYGTELRRCFQPLFTGVGPVESAMVLSHAMAELSNGDGLPDLLVSLGSAGSRTLEQTSVYQAVSVSYRDMDATPLGFEKGSTPFLDLPVEIPIPHRIPDVPTARLSTGANIVAGDGYDGIDADMVDMETYAVLRVAMRFGRPLIALRGISDGREDLSHIDDWTRYLHEVDRNLAAAVGRVHTALKTGELSV